MSSQAMMYPKTYCFLSHHTVGRSVGRCHSWVPAGSTPVEYLCMEWSLF